VTRVSLFDVVARITLDSSDYEEKINEAEKKGKGLGSKLGSALGTGLKVVAGAAAAAGAAVVGVVKQSVDAYSEYEQLAGGVETLFGSSAQKVMENSRAAFKAAGMSMNQYMETSVQSASALIKSLDGDQAKAAELMDLSIRDMSDNVNKFGVDMESVQNAYRGFSRGNFMMLDNLSLGFSGTKEGMEELLAKAKEFSGVEYDIDSYADIVQAIHVVQENLGVAGTTAKEAATTIQGSLTSTKAAWENLLTGLSDKNADIGSLVSDLVSSAGTLLGNLIPVAKQALTGIGQAVRELAPVIAEEIPALINDVVPELLTAAMTLVESLGSALLDNADYLIQDVLDLILTAVQHLADGNVIGKVIDAAFKLVNSIATWLGEYSNVLIEAAVTLILQLVQGLTNPSNLVSLVESALFLITSLAEGLIKALPQLLEQAPVIIENLVTAIVEALPLLIDAALSLIETLTAGILANLSPLITAAIQIISALLQGISQMLPQIVLAAPELIMSLVFGLMEALPEVIFAGVDIIMALVQGIADNVGALLEEGMDLIGQFLDTIVAEGKKLIDKGKELVDNVKSGVMQKVEDAKNWGRDLINNFVGGIKQKWENLKTTVSNVAGSIKSFLGFSEPEEGPLSDFHTYAPDMMELFAKGVRDNAGMVQDEIGDAFDFAVPELTATVSADVNKQSRDGNVIAELRDVLGRLRAIEPGALVGMIAPDMDAALGSRQITRARGLA